MKNIDSGEKFNSKPFTDDEIDMLSGSYSRLAKKHNCSPTYVRNICIGKAAFKSKLASVILIDLQNLLQVLKPENHV